MKYTYLHITSFISQFSKLSFLKSRHTANKSSSDCTEMVAKLKSKYFTLHNLK